MQTTKKTPKGSKAALKGTLKGHARNSQAKKQKEVIKEEGIQTESECDPRSAKSMTAISQNKGGSHHGKLKKEQKEINLEKENEKLVNNTKSATKNQKKNNKASKAETEDTKSVTKNLKKNNKASKTETEDKSNTEDITVKQNKRKRPLRKRKKVDYTSCGNESGSADDDEWDEKLKSESEESEDSMENCKKKDKTPLVRKRVPSAGSGSGTPNEGSGTSFVDLVDDDSDFEVSSKPLVKRKVSAGSPGSKKKAMKIISSDDSDESLKCLGSVCNENGK